MPWRFALFLAAFWSSALAAQDPVHRLIQTESGLASNEVYDVFQDSRGFIWIANGRGVSRFDGVHMRNFSIQEYTSEGASNLFEDRFGRIWFHSFWGQWFYVYNDSLHHFHSFNKQLINPEYDVVNQRVVFTTTDRLIVIHLHTLSFETTLLPATTKGHIAETDFIALPMMSPEGQILLISNEGVVLLLDSSYQVREIARGKSERPYPFRFAGALYLMQGNTLFQISTTGGLEIQERKQFPELQQARLASVRQFGKDRLLICTYNQGAYFYDRNIQILPEFTPGMFSSQPLSNAIQDREGNYWFGTLKKGVLLVQDIHIKKQNIRQALLNCLFYYQPGKLLLGYDDGVITMYDIDRKEEKTIIAISSAIKSIRKDRNNQVYAVSDFLFRLNIEGKSPIATPYFGTADCKDAVFTSENIPVVNNTSHCLAVIDQTSQTNRIGFLNKWNTIAQPEIFSQNGTSATIIILNPSRAFGLALNDKKDIIYSSSTAGFYALKPTGRKLVQYQGRNIFARAMIIVNDALYCATDLGLMTIKDDSVVSLFNTKNGLRSDHLRKVVYHEDRIYIVHEKGIDCIHLEGNKVSSLLASEVAPSAEITDLLFADGLLYVGTSNGLVLVPLTAFNKTTIRPLFHMGNMRCGPKEYPFGQNHTLPWNSQNIEFVFTGIHIRSEENLVYEYRLLGGGGSNWTSQSGNNTEVVFNRLPPGKYTFEARVRDIYGNYSDTLRHSFRITPPFWKTYWFGLLAFGGITLSFLVINRKMNRKRALQANQLLEQERIARALQQSQLSALKAQMNPHFMFNALNSIQEFILTNEKRLANQYLGKFSDLMRMTLDMSQDEEVLLADEIKSITLYLELEQLRFGKDLEILIDIAPEINPDSVYIPSMLIQPYIENALKHGLLHVKGQKILQISFALKPGEDVLVCTVEDNGIGRERSEAIKNIRNRQHRSFATSATQKRLEILNSGREAAISVAYTDKTDGGHEATGTTVVLEVPFVR
jgi:ligand-binding sensor domain-containing protein